MDFSLTSLTFSDGTEITLPEAGVTVIVGPNNSGKTAALREIISSTERAEHANQCNVVRAVRFSANGDTSDFQNWLHENASVMRTSGPTMMQTRFGQVPLTRLLNAWNGRSSGYLNEVTGLLMHSADVDSRQHIVGAGVPTDYIGQRPTQPVHFLYLDGALEERFSRLSEEYFGLPITLQRLGPECRLRVGRPNAEIPPLNRPTKEYAEAEADLPLLIEQGHGMRSFLGLILTLMVEHHPVILIDEPEVFLHPPQRRALGRLVNNLSYDNGTQVIVSTHDTEFLWGLLDGRSDVTVVRLTREGQVNHARSIAAGTIRSLWTDPMLRYSRLFDGIFYKRVVVCEADSDCRFYGAVVDYLVSVDNLAAPDCLFVPAGGKEKVPTAIEALKAIGVDAVAALDFDALRDSGTLKSLVQAADGEWNAEMTKPWGIFANKVKEKKIGKPTLALKSEVLSILSDCGQDIDRETSKQIQRLFSYTDGWEDAKRQGLAAVPSGEATQSCQRLIAALAGYGIFVLPQGELESLVREVGNHGPGWVADVLAKDLHKTATSAHDFVRIIANL